MIGRISVKGHGDFFAQRLAGAMGKVFHDHDHVRRGFRVLDSDFVLVVCGHGPVSQMQSAMQSDTQSVQGSHDAVIRIYDPVGNVIETHAHAGDSKQA